MTDIKSLFDRINVVTEELRAAHNTESILVLLPWPIYCDWIDLGKPIKEPVALNCSQDKSRVEIRLRPTVTLEKINITFTVRVDNLEETLDA